MTKKFKQTKCIYCLGDFEILTSDHVFPRSWYPSTTPPNMEKPQVPCLKCNQRYSNIEQKILERLAFGLSPDDAKSLGISEKVRNSLNPKRAKSKRDRDIRKKKRNRLLKDMFPAQAANKRNLLPGLDSQYGYPLKMLSALPIPSKELKELGEKFVRGIYYVVKNECIQDDYKIKIVFAHPENTQMLEDLIDEHGARFHSGPGINIGIAITPEDDVSSMYKIEIWGRLNYYAFVEKDYD